MGNNPSASSGVMPKEYTENAKDKVMPKEYTENAKDKVMPKEYTENAKDKVMKKVIYAMNAIEQAIKQLKYAEDSFEPRAKKALRNANNQNIELVRNTGNFSTKIIEDAVSKGIISVHEASELVKNITQRANTILKVVGEAESLHETLIKQRNQLSEQNQINEFNTLNNELKDVQKKAEAKAYASMENTKKITTATQLIMSGYAKHIQAQQPYDMNVASRKRPEAPNGGRRTHRKRKHKRTHRKRR